MNNKYDFPVEICPLITVVGTAQQEITKRKAVVRKDTKQVIGIVSEKYNLLKHATVVDTFRRALKGTNFKEKIRLAKNGSQMFAHYTLPGAKVEVRKGDIVSLQLIIKNSYDGSNALQIMLGAYRLVCENGMVIGKHFVSFSQKHIGSESGELKLDGIKARIDTALDNFKITLPYMQDMSRSKMAPQALDTDERLTLKGLPVYLIDEANTEYEKEKDFTAWGLYNALTFAITHKMKKESPIMQLHYGKVAWRETQKLLK